MTKHHANDAAGDIAVSKKYKRRISEIDKMIGKQFREFRKKQHLTQEAMGRIIGVTYQQIQKIESGQNRLAASTLLIVSVKTGASLEYFVRTAREYLNKENT